MKTLTNQLLEWGYDINNMFGAIVTIIAIVAGAILVIKAILELKNGSKNAKQAALYLACAIGCFAVAAMFGIGGGALARIGATFTGKSKSFLEDTSNTQLGTIATSSGGAATTTVTKATSVIGAFGF